MIQKDQPTIFPKNFIARVSSAVDGNMKYLAKGLGQIEVDENRADFLKKFDVTPEQTVLVQTTYDGDDYTRYTVVDGNNKGQGMVKPILFNSDSLATTTKNVAIFLPIADCIGAFMYDPVHEAIMVVHLGRQHIEQHGATKSVEFMKQNFQTDPQELLVWMGPAPFKEAYPLFSFDNRSLHEVSLEHLKEAGVNLANVTICEVDTTKDTNYFSHSEFLKGNRDTDGRYGIVAMLK